MEEKFAILIRRLRVDMDIFFRSKGSFDELIDDNMTALRSEHSQQRRSEGRDQRPLEFRNLACRKTRKQMSAGFVVIKCSIDLQLPRGIVSGKK